jgi:hypothetical protein
MKFPRSSSGVVRIFGYGIFAYGALSTIQYFAITTWRSVPTDMGIALGNGAITLTGLVAISIAMCFAQIEQRLDMLEKGRSPSIENDRRAETR